MRVRTLLLASAFLFVGLTLSPAAPVASACQSDLHTIQVVCLHETPKDYASCYLFEYGPLLWTNCV